MGTSIKIGLQEGVNFGVGAFLFLGEGLFRTFEFSLRQVWTLLTGGFNQAFGNIFGGLGKILLGVGKLILSRLGDPFREVVAVFQAGLFFAIDQLLVKLGNSKLGNMLGFEKINATSFEEALADFREKMDVGKLKGEGEKLIKDGLGQTGQAIKQSLDVSSENFRKSFDGLKFDPVSIFNTEEDKKALIDMLKQANPEGFKKIIDALNPPIESLKDTADKVDNAVNQARDIDKAVKKLNAPKPDKAGKGQAGETGRSGRKRIRLFNAADSLRRRFARQSKEDKTTFDDFVNKSGSNRSVVRRFARNNGISFADALKQLQAGGAAASPRRGGRIAAEKERLEAAKRMATEATLLRIATHLESIATRLTMSLTDKLDSVIIHDPSLMDGQWHAYDESPSRSADGWDTLRIPYYKLSATRLYIEDVAVDFPIGMVLAGRSFWVQDIPALTCRGAGLYEAVVEYKGLAGNQPTVITYGGSANQQSGENILVTEGGVTTLRPKVSTHENTPTATARYITLNTATAPTGDVGTAQIPPSPPQVRPSVWDFLTDPLYHYPNGWVLMSSDVTPLAGTTVGLVADSYQYIHANSPG